MPGANLKFLQPIMHSPVFEGGIDPSKARYRAAWERILAEFPPEQATPIITLAEEIYFKVLDHYATFQVPISFAALSRVCVKRWQSILESKQMLPIPFESFIYGLEISGTIPITTGRTKKGGLLITPSIAIKTIMSRAMRGEPTCEIEELITGEKEGPELSQKGAEQAYNPFPDSLRKADLQQSQNQG